MHWLQLDPRWLFLFVELWFGTLDSLGEKHDCSVQGDFDRMASHSCGG